MGQTLFGGYPGGRWLGQKEEAAALRVLKARSPYRFYGLDLQREADLLEKRLCESFGREHALAVSSGTGALQAALFAVGVSPGDEVILPAYGWGSDLMAIVSLGGVPVIAPIDDTLGLNPKGLQACLTDRTKAIVAIHMRGAPCALPEIVTFARARNIAVVEDGAQCLGGTVGGRPVGSSGDASILSFQYHKLITSGEGGAVLTDSEEIHERTHRFHDLGMLRRSGDPDPEGLDSMRTFGLNFRITEVQAAILNEQLQRVEAIKQRLKNNYGAARAHLSSIRDRFGLVERRRVEHTEPNHAFMCLLAESGAAAKHAMQAMVEEDIPVQACGRIDAHHFLAWEAYLKRDGKPHRVMAGKDDSDILDRSLFVEINADA